MGALVNAQQTQIRELSSVLASTKEILVSENTRCGEIIDQSIALLSQALS